jgi:hypothetical protein
MHNRNFNHMGHGPMGGHRMGHGPGMGPGFGRGPMHRGPVYGPMHRGPRPMRPMFFGPVFRPRPRYYGYGLGNFGCLGPFLILMLLAAVFGIR